MRNITGNPVDGDDFFGREEDLQQLRIAVEDGNHILLLGPRRVGKSSLIAELSRTLKVEGWTAIKVDVQDTADEAAFLQQIQEAVKASGIEMPAMATVAELVRGFRKFFRGSKVSVAGTGLELKDGDVDWEEVASQLKSLIKSLPDSGRRVLITIDELPIFLNKLLRSENGSERVRRILDWLRSVRQACGTRLPWILCGSIGLDSFVVQHGLEGSINELLPQPLGALEPAQALELLKRLGLKRQDQHQCKLSDEVAGYMVQRVGWPIPYYLQLLFHALKSLRNQDRSKDYPAAIDVQKAYETLLSPQFQTHLGHWDSRLGDLLDGHQVSVARELLNHLCEHPNGRNRDQLRDVLAREFPQADPGKLDRELRELLEFLERDGYLGREGAIYAFRSFLLRDFWKRKFGE